MSEPRARRLVAGMVGGGAGADIGKTHRRAMRLDGEYDLRAGVFGRDRVRSDALASELGIPEDRRYAGYREMADSEAGREDGIDVVVVATPNDSHFEIARAFLESGISVVCEKPLTRDSATAAELVRLAADNGAILAVPHCYSAYAMVRHAARMVRDGQLGAITFADVEHASGWAGHLPWNKPGTSRPPGGRTRTSPASPASLAISARTASTFFATSPGLRPRGCPAG